MIKVNKAEVEIKGTKDQVNAELAVVINALAQKEGQTPAEFIMRMIPILEMTRAIVDEIGRVKK